MVKNRVKNQQLNPHNYDAESVNRTWATLVGGECSHHCATTALKNNKDQQKKIQNTIKKVLWFSTDTTNFDHLCLAESINKRGLLITVYSMTLSYLKNKTNYNNY